MSHDGSDAAAGDVAPIPDSNPVLTQADRSRFEPSPQPAERRVLVVEDEPNISEAIRYILQRDGFSVTLLASGEGVLETIAAKDPALVILDAMLPGVSGLDILRALRGQPGTAALPVILLTAKGSAQAREQAIEAGASLFMAKPFANAALLEAVRNLVEA